MRARLYGMDVSHPANAARLMLVHKGVPHDVTAIPPGAQLPWMRLAGFERGTVPAIRFADGRKVQGTLAISRALDDLRPDPPLFPADRRADVEAAEAWGERELQPVPRRLLRWALSTKQDARVVFARQLGLPVPAASAYALLPAARLMARAEQAHDEAVVRADADAVPSHLARVDAWIDEGLLDGDHLNAADFQIGTTLRVMLAFADFEPLIAGRSAERLARRVWPDFAPAVPHLLH